MGGLEWGRERWLSIFALHLDSPRLWLGSSVAQLQRRWAGEGGSSLPGLSRDSAGTNLTPQPPPGQLLQSVKARSSRVLVALLVGFALSAEASPERADSRPPPSLLPEARTQTARGAARRAELPGRRTEQWRGVWERSGRAQRTRENSNVLG